jgi:hypothetical protein
VALASARPYRHPKTGVYYFRRRVPAHLAGHFGRTVEKRSLGTKDPSEARIRFAEVAAEFDALWRETGALLVQRATPRTPRELSHKEIHAIAGEVYRAVVAAHEDDPGDATRWEGALLSSG